MDGSSQYHAPWEGLVCGLAVEGGGVVVVLLVIWRRMGTLVLCGCFDFRLFGGVAVP